MEGLIKGLVSQPLKVYLKTANEVEQQDPEKAINAFCEKIEEIIFNAIKNANLTVPPGLVNVTGTNGPASNITPIIVQKGLS